MDVISDQIFRLRLISRMWAGLVTLILAVFFCISDGSAQITSSTQSLTVFSAPNYLDNPAFAPHTVVEFPFTLYRNEFTFFKPDSLDPLWYARIFAQVTLYDEQGTGIDSTTTYFTVPVVTASEGARLGIRLFNRLVLESMPGIYSARLVVIDAVNKRRGEIYFPKVPVPASRTERIAIGGECLAYKITYVAEDTSHAPSPTTKNGFDVLFNPLAIFGPTDTIIYVYGELYNLFYDKTQSSTYTVSYDILDDTGAIAQSYGFKTRKQTGTSAVETQSFSLIGCAPGLYTVRMIAADQSHISADTALLRFRLASKNDILRASTLTASFDPYDTLSYQVKLNLSSYFLTPEQKITVDRLSDSGKINFLKQFWKERDIRVETDINEDRIELIHRYETANLLFSTRLRIDGWASDRGRIYITYGQWEERKDIPSPEDERPFEIWYYRSQEEGILFVFEDKQGFQDYTLVHSNANGEKFDVVWKARISEEFR